MFGTLCNELCIRMRRTAYAALGKAAGVLARRAGLKVVEAEAVMLPKGCRAIPMHHYDVDPDVLLQVKDGNRAILYQSMKNWQVSNQRTGKADFLKGDRWGTKSDPKYWHKMVFPFLTARTVKAMVADLVEASLLAIDGTWCQPLKLEVSGVQQMTLDFGKDFQQPGKVFRSSIKRESNSPKTNMPKQTTKRAGTRKDAVADFNLPEHRESIAEIREASETEHDGRDVLALLPGALVTQWTDAKLPLESLVAKHGAEVINATWSKAAGFKNQVAGLRTLLANAPAPRSAAPPIPDPDATEPDQEPSTTAPEDTPIFDIPDLAEDRAKREEQARQEWLKQHVSPELLARMAGES